MMYGQKNKPVVALTTKPASAMRHGGSGNICIEVRNRSGRIRNSRPKVTRVVSLCDYSGVMVKPWLEAGAECWCVDLTHAPGVRKVGGIYQVGADINIWQPPFESASAVFAFPPCTDIAVSGAKWFTDKGLQSVIDALTTVESCRELCEKLSLVWFLENPVSVLASFWRKPDFMFHPSEFAGYLGDSFLEAYTKKTCIWCSPAFQIPIRKPVPAVRGSIMHKLPPSEARAMLRSLTPTGFAQAVYQANAPVVEVVQ